MSTKWDDFTPIDEDVTDSAAVDWASFTPIEAKNGRNAFAVANDTVIEAGNAVASGAGAIANFISPGNRFSRSVDEFVKSGEEKQSDVTKADKEQFRSDLQNSDTISDDLAAVGRHVVSSPLQVAAQAAGSFAGPGLAVGAARGLAGLLGVGAKIAGRVGLGAGATTGAAMGGGDAAGSAYELVQQISDDVLLKVPEVVEMRNSGMSMQDVRHEVATAAARDASVFPALAGGVAGLVGAERLLAVGKVGQAGVKGVLATGAIEGATEAAEEGLTQFEGRRAAQQYDQSIDPTKNVAAMAAMGGITGFGTGAGLSAITRPTPKIEDIASAESVDEAIAAANAVVTAPHPSANADQQKLLMELERQAKQVAEPIVSNPIEQPSMAVPSEQIAVPPAVAAQETPIPELEDFIKRGRTKDELFAEREAQRRMQEDAAREQGIAKMLEAGRDQQVEQAEVLTQAQGFDSAEPTAMQLAMQKAQERRRLLTTPISQRQPVQAESPKIEGQTNDKQSLATDLPIRDGGVGGAEVGAPMLGSAATGRQIAAQSAPMGSPNTQAVVPVGGTDIFATNQTANEQPALGQTAPQVADVAAIERRLDANARKLVDQMTPEEMRRALLTDEMTGLGNRRAYNEVVKKPFQASIDIDSLKWINDNMGHEAGDQLIQAVGTAMRDEIADSYHLSGDEFAAQFDDEVTGNEAIARVRERLNGATFTYTAPDGTVITKQGAELSYGIADTYGAADEKLKADKAGREARGERAGRGAEPAGVVRKPAARREIDRDAAAQEVEAGPQAKGEDAKFFQPGSAAEESIVPETTFKKAGPFKTKTDASLFRDKHKLSGVSIRQTEGGWVFDPTPAPLTDAEREAVRADIQALNKTLKANGIPAVLPIYTAPTANHQLARSIAKVFGAEVRFVSNNKVFQGVAHRGKAFIASSMKHPELAITGHETFHVMEQTNPELADGLLEQVRAYLQDDAIPDRQMREELMAGRSISERYAAGEVLADLNGAMWLDPKFWREMVQRDVNLFRRVAYVFMENATKAIESLTGTRFDVEALVTDVDKVRSIIAQAWADHNQGRDKKTPKDDDVQFSRVDADRSATPDKPNDSAIPEETSTQAARRVIQDKFNRFKVLQANIEMVAAQEAGYQGDDIFEARAFMEEKGILNPISDQSDVYQAETLMSGRISTRKEDFRERQMNPLIEKTYAAGLSMSQVADFLKMQHAPEANNRAREIQGSPEATAFGISDEKAAQAMKEFKALPNFSELKSVANEWRAITEQSKKILLDAGIITKEIADAWDATYSVYVPVKGKDSKSGGGKGLSVNGRQKQRLGHSERDEAILENILRDHERAISNQEVNEVGMTLIRFGLAAKNPDIMTIEKPAKRQVLKDASAFEVQYNGNFVAAFSDKASAEAFKAKDALKNSRDTKDYSIEKTTNPYVALMTSPLLAENEVNVYVAGHAVRIQINDEIAARAYTNLGVESLGAILSAGREINSWLSKAYTGYSPDFILTNPIRDAIQGSITLAGEHGAGMAAKIFGNYPLAVKELVKHFREPGKSKLVTEYRAAGGSTGAAYLSDLERIGNDVMAAYDECAGAIATYRRVYAEKIESGASPAKAGTYAAAKAGLSGFKNLPVIGHFLRLMERINAVTENALRVATFKTLVDNGVSRPKAAAQAKNLMNFNRKGELSNQAGALYLFFNPSVQGASLFADTLATSKHKNQARALAGTMTLAALFLAEAARSDGEDDERKWKQTPDHVKDRNWVVGFGDYQFTLPLPYGYGVFQTLGNVMSDYMHGEDGYKLGIRLASSVFGNFSPIGNPMEGKSAVFSMSPTLLKLAGGPGINENTFGQQIKPDQWGSSKPESQLMYRSTKGSSYAEIAESLNAITGGSKFERGIIDVSPETLKYWVKSLTGGAGQFAFDSINIPSNLVQGAPLDPKDIPVARRFVREVGVTDARSAFWEKANAVKAAADTFSTAKKSGDMAAARAIFNENKALISLADYARESQKMAKARRDQADKIRMDDAIPLAVKHERMKIIEMKEAAVYQRFLKNFDARTEAKK